MVKVGIIGTGRIAHRFVPEAAYVNGMEIQCVYNPHIRSAEAFAKQFMLPAYTDNLEKLTGMVDAVYIASPHSTHYDYVRTLLLKHKHVLCEKPLCFSEEQAGKLYELAKKMNCVFMEAIKTAYCPGFIAMMDMAVSGKIGEIRDVEACFTRLTDGGTREWTDDVFGGSFTEFGSYVLLPIIKLLGTGYQSVHFHSLCLEHGVDEYTKAYLGYKNGMALTKTGLGVKSEGQLVVAGTEGYILAPSPWWLTREFEIRYEDSKRKEVYRYPFEGQGLRYEIEAFHNAIIGAPFPGGMKEEESVAIAGVMECFLRKRNRV